MAKESFTMETRHEFLPKLSNMKFVQELCDALYDLFSVRGGRGERGGRKGERWKGRKGDRGRGRGKGERGRKKDLFGGRGEKRDMFLKRKEDWWMCRIG